MLNTFVVILTLQRIVLSIVLLFDQWCDTLKHHNYSFVLYKSESILQVGTLEYFRETYNRKNVTPKIVVDCFKGSEEFFISVGKSYIVAALLEFFGMKSVDDQPTNYTIPSNFTSAKKKSKERLFWRNSREIRWQVHFFERLHWKRWLRSKLRTMLYISYYSFTAIKRYYKRRGWWS